MNPDLNIFVDLDGTLLDIIDKYYAVYSVILNDDGCRPLDIETYWKMKREGFANVEILLKGKCSLSVDIFQEQFAKLIEEPEYLRLDKLKPGIKDFLKVLSEIGELMLVTLRKNRTTLLEQLRSLDIERYFKGIVNDTINDVQLAWQKKEYLFRTCLYDNTSVVIGDSGAEIRAGKTLGLKTIALSWGIRSKRILKKYNPDYILSDVSQVIPCLCRK